MEIEKMEAKEIGSSGNGSLQNRNLRECRFAEIGGGKNGNLLLQK
jgi:hypothetical protein